MAKIEEIKKGIQDIKTSLQITEPAHFSKKDIVDAFFGALFLGVTFAVKGLLIDIALALKSINVILIVLSTLLILTAEIYYIGYARVRKKSERKFGQFWIKRMVAFYLVAILTAVFLVYLFGLNNLPQIFNNPENIFKLVILISLPCSIGASITDLIKKF